MPPVNRLAVLDNTVTNVESPLKSMVKKNKLILTSAVLLSLVFIASVAFGSGSITGASTACEPNQVLEEYAIEEPYLTFEDTFVPMKYIILSEYDGLHFYNWNYSYIGKIRLRNIDTEPGIFTIRGKFKDGSIETVQELRKDLQPEADTLFYFEHPIGKEKANVSFSYEVVPAEKIKTEAVTKYRNETRYKVVNETTCA